MEDYLSVLCLNFLVSSHLPDTVQRGMLEARESLENVQRQLRLRKYGKSKNKKCFKKAFFYLMTVEKNVKFSWKEAFWNFCRVNKNTSCSRRKEKAKKSESFLTESNANSVCSRGLN